MRVRVPPGLLRLRRHAPHRARGRLPTPPPRAHRRLPAVRGALRALRPGVRGTLRGAGRVARRGFARIRCPSCQAKRSALFAEHVITELLEPVLHRHVVLTIPRVLRGLFQRERRLLGLLARAAPDAIVPSARAILDRHDLTPGLVLSIQTFGSYAASSCSSRTSTRDSSRRSSAAACSSACTAPNGSRRSSVARSSAGSTRDSRCTASKPSRPKTPKAPSASRAS